MRARLEPGARSNCALKRSLTNVRAICVVAPRVHSPQDRMAEAMVQAMRKNLVDMADYVKMQVEGGRDKADVLQLQFDAARSRLNSFTTPLTTEQATAIGCAINGGPWAAGQKQRVP